MNLSHDPPGVYLTPPAYHPPPDHDPRATGATAPASPGRVAVLEARAEQELRELAAELHARQIDPVDILLELHDRLRLLVVAAATEGAALPMRPLLPLVREVCGLSDSWDAEQALRQRAEAEVEGRRQRALALADWLQEHAGEPVAERIVQTVELTVADRIAEEAYAP